MSKQDTRTRERTREQIRQQRCLERMVCSPERDEALERSYQFERAMQRRERIIVAAAWTILLGLGAAVLGCIAAVIL